LITKDTKAVEWHKYLEEHGRQIVNTVNSIYDSFATVSGAWCCKIPLVSLVVNYFDVIAITGLCQAS
jgi:hypothetical protein